MTNKEAIKTLHELWRTTNDPWYEKVYEMAIHALKAQEQLAKNSPKVDKGNGDLISRAAALSAITKRMEEVKNPFTGNGSIFWEGMYIARSIVGDLPSAETHGKRMEKRTETHACDLISRQAAIDAHYEYCNKHPDAGFPVWSLKILEDLPSAQPEIIRCKDCKYNSNTCGNYVNCDIIPQMFGRTTDNFCSYAERRTDGN